MNEHVREFIKKSDYEGVFTVYGQRLTYSSPNDSLGRYLIEGNKPKVFTEAANFGGSTSGGNRAGRGNFQGGLPRQPADGETVHTALPLIQSESGELRRDRQESVQMRVSGLGLVPASSTIRKRRSFPIRSRKS